jgi:hypothetical protein
MVRHELVVGDEQTGKTTHLATEAQNHDGTVIFIASARKPDDPDDPGLKMDDRWNKITLEQLKDISDNPGKLYIQVPEEKGYDAAGKIERFILKYRDRYDTMILIDDGDTLMPDTIRRILEDSRHMAHILLSFRSVNQIQGLLNRPFLETNDLRRMGWDIINISW